MEAILKEFSLLKGYVVTLEKENQARNIEKDTLFQEIDRLTAQIDRLNDLLLTINQDKQKLGQIAQLKQVQNQLYVANSRIITLENSINIYQSKSDNYSNYENIKILEKKNAEELQNCRRFQADYRRINADYKKMQTKLKRIEGQNRDLRFNNKSIFDKEVSDLKSTIIKLSSDLKIKENQISLNVQQQQKLIIQVKSLRQIQNQSSAMSNKLSLLERQLNNCKINANRTSALELDISKFKAKNIQLENHCTILQTDFKRIDSDFKRLELEHKRLQAQNRDFKINSKSLAQFSNILDLNLNLQGTIRQLHSQVERLEVNLKGLEQQKLSLQQRQKDLEQELAQTKSKLTQSKLNEQSYRSMQSSIYIKEKQMEALEQLIRSLKESKKCLQKIIRDKDQVITSLQSQVYIIKSSKRQSQNSQRQLTKLRIQLEDRISIVTKNSQKMEFELSNFRQKQRNFIIQLHQLKQQKQKLLRQRHLQSGALQQIQRQVMFLKSQEVLHPQVTKRKDYHPERDRNVQNGQQLKMIVDKLRSEVEELKIYQFKSKNNQFNNIHLKNIHMIKQVSTPIEGSQTIQIVSHERDRNSFNKSKWQHLQQKINVLKYQNDSLKKSLF